MLARGGLQSYYETTYEIPGLQPLLHCEMQAVHPNHFALVLYSCDASYVYRASPQPERPSSDFGRPACWFSRVGPHDHHLDARRVVADAAALADLCAALVLSFYFVCEGVSVGNHASYVNTEVEPFFRWEPESGNYVCRCQRVVIG